MTCLTSSLPSFLLCRALLSPPPAVPGEVRPTPPTHTYTRSPMLHLLLYHFRTLTFNLVPEKSLESINPLLTCSKCSSNYLFVHLLVHSYVSNPHKLFVSSVPKDTISPWCSHFGEIMAYRLLGQRQHFRASMMLQRADQAAC